MAEPVRLGRALRYLRSAVRAGACWAVVLCPDDSVLDETAATKGMRDAVDRRLAANGRVYARYDDTWIVLCSSLRAAKRMSAKAQELRLRAVGRPSHSFEFCGYSADVANGELALAVSEAAVSELKSCLKKLTQRSSGMSMEQRQVLIARKLRSFKGHFRYAGVADVAGEIDDYLRLRVALVLWKNWKRVRSKVRALRSLGASERSARRMANKRDGLWACATDPELLSLLTFSKLRELGFQFLRPLSYRIGA